MNLLWFCSLSLFIVSLWVKYHKPPLIDLESNIADFVIETKQIIIPDFPGAFNPCVVRWRDSILMSFRVRNSEMISTFQIGMVWLNDNFQPISKATILEMRHDNPSFSRNQDPRLITINEQLYVVYSSFVKDKDILTRRMCIAQVHYEKEQFYIESSTCLRTFQGSSSRWEKNWVPFVYHGNLLLAYSILPHMIFKPSPESSSCTTVASTTAHIDWEWGELRGGTPALLDHNEYLAFFHSSKPFASVNSQNKMMPHYVMGAYTFSSKPPFEITQVSPEPIVGKNFYHGAEYTTWKPLRVVFPMGYIMDQNYIWVTYGRQDFEMWVAKVDKKGLYKSLIACTTTRDGSSTLSQTEQDEIEALIYPLDEEYYETS